MIRSVNAFPMLVCAIEFLVFILQGIKFLFLCSQIYEKFVRWLIG